MSQLRQAADINLRQKIVANTQKARYTCRRRANQLSTDTTNEGKVHQEQEDTKGTYRTPKSIEGATPAPFFLSSSVSSLFTLSVSPNFIPDFHFDPSRPLPFTHLGYPGTLLAPPVGSGGGQQNRSQN